MINLLQAGLDLQAASIGKGPLASDPETTAQRLSAALDKLEQTPGFKEYMLSTGRRKAIEGIE